MGEVDCDPECSGSRHESHVIAALLRRFVTQKLDFLGARYEFMTGSKVPTLHVLVVGATAAFRRDPIDDLVRILDVAGFAVHAIGRIDL